MPRSAVRHYELKQKEHDPVYLLKKHGENYELKPAGPRPVPGRNNSGAGLTTRGEIKGMSSASWGRLVLFVSRITNLSGFATLTLPGDWRKAAPTAIVLKNHFNAHLKRIHRNFPQHCQGHIWILEFQERGAPHFHYWTVGDPPTPEASAFLCDDWERRTGAHRNEWAPLLKTDGAARYVGKEGGKRLQKVPPQGWKPGRLWGHRGALQMDDVETVGPVAQSELPPEVLTKFRSPYRTVFGEVLPEELKRRVAARPEYQLPK